MFSFFKRKKGNKDTHNEKEASHPSAVSPDTLIHSEIERKFQAEQYLREHNLEVGVFNGVVTLSGVVTSPLLLEMAEQIASATPGVMEVNNKIELGIGKAGEDVTTVDIAPDDVALSEASNTGDENLHHPSTTAFSEVRSTSPSDYTGGADTGYTADEPAQFSILPTTGQGSSVMDAGADDAIRMSGVIRGEEVLSRMITEGMAIYDLDGNKIGVVKQARSTDFLLDRTLAQDIYVPYYACRYEKRQLIVDVPSDEIDKQGWAKPILF